jgi:hypothetical protein
MYGLAGFAYVGAIIAFSVIFAVESNKSTTETMIGSADVTGQDGYTCKMISKVTASYEVTASIYLDPHQAFQLINVIESRTQYESDYSAADPCSQPLEYFQGSITPIYSGPDLAYGGVALYGEDTLIVANVHLGRNLLFINYTMGTFNSYYTADIMLIDSIAVDADGNPLYLAASNTNEYTVYRLDHGTALGSYTEVELFIVETSFQPVLVYDNLYNIYLVEHDNFTALDVYSDSTTGTASMNTTLFSTRAGEYITHAAVYNSGIDGGTGGSIKVYYLNNTQGVTVWENGVFTELGHYPGCVQLAVDGADNPYVLVSDGSKSLSLILVFRLSPPDPLILR